jgi:SGNH domain (fused to AT3 domains)
VRSSPQEVDGLLSLREIGILSCGQGTSGCILPRAAVEARQAKLRVIMAKLQQAHPDIRVFDPLERFCLNSQCIYTEAGQLLYEDSNHLSHYGSDRYAEALSRWLTSR